tara:strand:+ start:196 stop:567 length:372 start_codon:yes stop_codon:yes gene_type:complete
MCQKTVGSMKKILILLSSVFLLSGCIETASLIAPMSGAANGKVAQTTVNSAISFSIKRQTGKSPMEHAIGFADQNNLKTRKAQKKCVSFLENTSKELCAKLENKFVKIQNIIEDKYQIKKLDE